MLWTIIFEQEGRDSARGWYRPPVYDDYGEIVAVTNEEGLRSAMEAQIQTFKELLADEYNWMKTATEEVVVVDKVSEHRCEVCIRFPREEKRYQFIASELSKSCEHKRCSRKFSLDDANQLFTSLGFGEEMAALHGKDISWKEDLWPLLFIQFSDNNWQARVKEKLNALNHKVVIWAGEFSYYCKYRDMSNKDHYCGISTNLAEMNQRVLSLTRSDRGDCMDDVNEGSATEPCDLSLFPGGGQYVLNAGVKKLSKMEWSHYTCKLLKKVPVQDFIRIFEACGLSEEIAQIPAKSRKPASLAEPLSHIVANDMEKAREELVKLISSDNSSGVVGKKRKSL